MNHLPFYRKLLVYYFQVYTVFFILGFHIVLYFVTILPRPCGMVPDKEQQKTVLYDLHQSSATHAFKVTAEWPSYERCTNIPIKSKPGCRQVGSSFLISERQVLGWFGVPHVRMSDLQMPGPTFVTASMGMSPKIGGAESLIGSPSVCTLSVCTCMTQTVNIHTNALFCNKWY